MLCTTTVLKVNKEIDNEQALKVIKRVSLRYRHLQNFLPLEDLRQEGYLGFLKGHQTWIEGKGCCYETWAIKHVVWAMCEAIQKEYQQRAPRKNGVLKNGNEWQDAADLALIVSDVCEELTAEEQELLKMRFWDNKTQEECAQHFGVVQRTCGKRESFALDKLRSKLSPVGEKRADLRPDKGGRWPSGYD